MKRNSFIKFFRISQPQGFSLIEVIMAIVILEVITVSVLNMYGIGGRNTVSSQDRLVANNLFQWKVEEIKCKGFADDVSETNGTLPGYSDYVFNVTQTVPFDGNAFLKQINVTMDWTSYLGQSKQEQISLYIADF